MHTVMYGGKEVAYGVPLPLKVTDDRSGMRGRMEKT